ncbi:MAG: LysM peptidoglycan-binding domain-containing protein [Bacteroidetes bacterium]|nr:LysM peptidoglycan-binding domain-containing protein [Bacteroidota bacterium]
MKKSRFIILFLIIGSWNVTTAQQKGQVCEVKVAGQEYVLHLVELGDNLFRIAKKYNSTVNDIWEVNPSIVDNTIIPGQVIKVSKNSKDKAPVGELVFQGEEEPLILKPEKVESKLDSSKLVLHEVGAGQTLFAISRLYSVSVEDLKDWNGLNDFSIGVGQTLIVSKHGELKVFDEITEEVKSYQPSRKPVKRDANLNSRQDLLHQKYLEETSGKKSQKERGAAEKLITNNPEMQTVYYGLHKSAPVGSVVKVVNLVNRKSVFVKVLAPLPNIPENENVQIKLSPAATKELVMLDARSLVELSYYK